MWLFELQESHLYPYNILLLLNNKLSLILQKASYHLINVYKLIKFKIILLPYPMENLIEFQKIYFYSIELLNYLFYTLQNLAFTSSWKILTLLTLNWTSSGLSFVLGSLLYFFSYLIISQIIQLHHYTQNKYVHSIVPT